MISLSFHGAAQTVTGSKYLLQVNDESVLIDCGMFQGKKELRQLNWEPFGFPVKSVSAVVITHTHIDHIGCLPKLGKEGYRGPIYCTPPTIDFAKILLLDTAMLQEEDAEFRNKRRLSSHPIALPLFTTQDVEQLTKQYMPVQFGEWVTLSSAIRFRYHIAGHILGAASVEFELQDGNRKETILFSGDVGRYGSILTVDPERPPDAHYLICESTYGDKRHPGEDTASGFAKIIADVVKQKHILLIPAFAVGRTQQITYLINRLMKEKLCPPIDIHIDSPMAIAAGEIYRKYPQYHRVDPMTIGGEECCLYGQHVFFHKTRQSSKELNNLEGPAVIISASGMMNGGRILHHLMNRLGRTDTTLALVGFMAEGTLGRKIEDGEPMIYIHKQPVDVMAQVVKLTGLSGHADYTELLRWLDPIAHAPKQTFITHGEISQSNGMALHLKQERNWTALVPELHQTVEL